MNILDVVNYAFGGLTLTVSFLLGSLFLGMPLVSDNWKVPRTLFIVFAISITLFVGWVTLNNLQFIKENVFTLAFLNYAFGFITLLITFLLCSLFMGMPLVSDNWKMSPKLLWSFGVSTVLFIGWVAFNIK